MKYGSVLRKLMGWWVWEEITRVRMVEHREHLHKDHPARTVNGTLSAINSFPDYIGRRDLQIKHQKVHHQTFQEPGKGLPRGEYERLVETAKEQGDDRLALLPETICSSGIRVSEARYITVEAGKRRKTEVYLNGKIRTTFLTKSICAKLPACAKEHHINSGRISSKTGNLCPGTRSGRRGRPCVRLPGWSCPKCISSIRAISLPDDITKRKMKLNSSQTCRGIPA